MRQILQYKNEIIIIIIIIIFTFIIKSEFTKYSLQLEKLKEKKEEIKKRNELIEKWRRLNKEYEEIKKSFFLKDNSLFRRFIEEKSQHYSLTITSLRPLQREIDFFQVGELEMSLTSKKDNISNFYKNFVSFIKDIEEKNIEVEKLVIRSSDSTREVKLNLKSIILKE
jgi:hypothetical protein